MFQVSGLQTGTCEEAGPEDVASGPRDFTARSEAATSLGQYCRTQVVCYLYLHTYSVTLMEMALLKTNIKLQS